VTQPPEHPTEITFVRHLPERMKRILQQRRAAQQERANEEDSGMVDSLSDSTVQREAEPIILVSAAVRLGVPSLVPGKFPLGDGIEVRVDGVSPDGRVYIEA
jgi:hypothetical protein